MSSVMHHIATAVLPVALGLLAAQLAAVVILAADEPSVRVRRIARTHAGPLGIWCLGAVAVHVAGLLGAGDLHASAIALIAGMAAVSVGLRLLPEARPRPPGASAVPAPEPLAADPVRPTDGSLWIGASNGEPESASSAGLWR